MDYDVIVVGAGPCGLIAARDLAAGSARVCVIEKSPEIGYPVKCSGLFSVSGLKHLDLAPENNLTCSTIKGGRFYSPGGEEFLAYSDKDRARVVERKMFDKELAKQAIRKGAEIKLKTLALGMKSHNGISLRINEVGEEKTITSRLLIGADGSGSQIARWNGLKQKTSFISGVQVEVESAEIEDDVAEVYLGKRYAPGFYAWILPKGDTYEVGIGSNGMAGETPTQLLKRFLSEHPIASRKITGKSFLEFNKGAIPVGGPLERTVASGVMLVGDSAAQTKASTGGGVITGGICARLAAKAALTAIREKDFSTSFLLKNYEQRWRAELEKEFLAHLFLKKLLDSASDNELDGLFNLLKKEGIPDLMTRYSDTDRPLDFVREVLKKEGVLSWAQNFLDVKKDLPV